MIQSKMIMKMAAAAILMTLAACDGQKWSEKQVDSFTYDFAFGLNWQGVIHDARVEKYK